MKRKRKGSTPSGRAARGARKVGANRGDLSEKVEARLAPSDGYLHGETSHGGKAIAEYYYDDENGEAYHRIDRIEVEGRKRHKFSQYHWAKSKKGKQYWKKNAPKGPKIPYQLQRLTKADPEELIIITEGEKDADNAIDKLGLVATTNPNGAGKWLDYFKDHFKGKKRVAIIEDNDEPGRRHVQDVARNLNGTVPDIRIVSLPDLARC